jgi:hypothetical protein
MAREAGCKIGKELSGANLIRGSWRRVKQAGIETRIGNPYFPDSSKYQPFSHSGAAKPTIH